MRWTIEEDYQIILPIDFSGHKFCRFEWSGISLIRNDDTRY